MSLIITIVRGRGVLLRRNAVRQEGQGVRWTGLAQIQRLVPVSRIQAVLTVPFPVRPVAPGIADQVAVFKLLRGISAIARFRHLVLQPRVGPVLPALPAVAVIDVTPGQAGPNFLIPVVENPRQALKLNVICLQIHLIRRIIHLVREIV